MDPCRRRNFGFDESTLGATVWGLVRSAGRRRNFGFDESTRKALADGKDYLSRRRRNFGFDESTRMWQIRGTAHQQSPPKFRLR
jgi:hypothetical protein